MELFDKYPSLFKQLESFCKTRPNEVLSYMLTTDHEYEMLCCGRADASMALKNALAGTEADTLIEKYSDAIYAQETYELEAIYRQAFCDALRTLKEYCLY